MFQHGVGYHSAAWIEVESADVRDGRRLYTAVADRPMLRPLDLFVAEVARIVADNGYHDRVGVAYMRVIDGAHPENYMAWHIDPLDDGRRYHTAISTDGVPVNLAFLYGHDIPDYGGYLDRPVADTFHLAPSMQPPNGDIVAFTTEAHGVLPQWLRPGQLTAIFFATLYKDRQAADLYTTNNTTTDSHAMLPTLEPTR